MRVIVYKNLRRGDWSIAEASGRNGMGRGRVIDHKSSLALRNVSWFVQESGRLRVVAKQCREVHAWAIGEIVDAIPDGMTAREVTYNPYRAPMFTDRTGQTVEASAYVEFTAQHGAISHD